MVYHWYNRDIQYLYNTALTYIIALIKGACCLGFSFKKEFNSEIVFRIGRIDVMQCYTRNGPANRLERKELLWYHNPFWLIFNLNNFYWNVFLVLNDNSNNNTGTVIVIRRWIRGWRGRLIIKMIVSHLITWLTAFLGKRNSVRLQKKEEEKSGFLRTKVV